MKNFFCKIAKEQNSQDTQIKQIEKWLKGGKSITQQEALNLFGCWRLSSVIHVLRGRGLNIKTERVKTKRNAIIGKYFIVK